METGLSILLSITVHVMAVNQLLYIHIRDEVLHVHPYQAARHKAYASA